MALSHDQFFVGVLRVRPAMEFKGKNVQYSTSCLHNIFAGLFIVLPCIESYKKVDLRTITLGVPPQEVYKE